MLRWIMLLLMLLFASQLMPQVIPKEGSKLNYRLIGFLCPEKSINKYKIEIAKGTYTSVDSFEKNVIISVEGNDNKIIAEVPSFGSQYTWRSVYYVKKMSVRKSILRHFATMIVPNVDTTIRRLRIINKAQMYKDAYVFVDGSNALYDMDGKPVWFLPENDELHTNHKIATRDLKLSPAGTITFMNDEIYEVDYNGNVLWQGPDNNEQYHHQFSRLANGNYVVMGNEFPYWDMSQKDSLVLISGNTRRDFRGDTNYRGIRMGTLIEYNQQGEQLWKWHSSQYFKGSDIFYHTMINGEKNLATHDNAFFFDETDSVFYISYKFIDRIIKVKYPEGNVINAYGEVFKPGKNNIRNNLFCGQHCCMVSDKKELYLFNNNACNPGALPHIIIVQQPCCGGDSLGKIWDYECQIESEDSDVVKGGFSTGGSVTELPDKSIFADMSDEYSKLFIVSPDKNILWCAMPERFDPMEKKWVRVHSYKAYIVYKKDIEKLVLSVK